MIPQVNLSRQHQKLRAEIISVVEKVLDSNAFIQGPFVQAFEKEFAEVAGAAGAAGCSNGTAALFLALKALGIGPGDEVITTPHTFFATAEAICETGARPVFADIDPVTYNIDPEQIQAALSPSTRAIVPVHLYGRPADMTSIMAIAEKHDLLVVEDCAQAHLAKIDGQPVGTFGAAGTFSFFPGKNLGACGDAGAVISNNAELIDQIRRLANHGRTDKYTHASLGYNHRMDGVQAAILRVKLRYLPEWTAHRQRLAGYYSQGLSDLPEIQTPGYASDTNSVFHLYVIETPNRDRALSSLREQKIEAGVHYPIPLHLQPALSFLDYKAGDFPMTERAAERILTLPLCPELTLQEIDFIIREVTRIVHEPPNAL